MFYAAWRSELVQSLASVRVVNRLALKKGHTIGRIGLKPSNWRSNRRIRNI